MSARELCRQVGVSERMYEEFLRPTLLVGLFAPPEDLSAAVVLETLEFYALGHQNSFDVCWCGLRKLRPPDAAGAGGAGLAAGGSAGFGAARL